MLVYKNPNKSTLYIVLSTLTTLCIVAIPVTWYLTGEFPIQAIGGIALAVSAVIGMKNNFNNYVALSDDRLIISAHPDPTLSNDIYILNEVRKIEFRREGWLSGANYQIAITMNTKSITEVKPIGAMGTTEIMNLSEDLRKRGIEVIIV